MPQTLLSLCATLVFSIVALNQNRHGSSLERAAVGREVERAALTLARERLGAALGHAFDEADVGQAALRTSTLGLTAPAALGPDAGEASPAAYDDVDDFDGLTAVAAVEVDGGAVDFDVTVAVRYVEPGAPETAAAAAALAKEVTVTVRERTAGATARPPVAGTLRAVVTAQGGALGG
jgi:hypothetical protein